MPARPRRKNPPLFIGRWLNVFGIRPADAARRAHINEGYLSQLISGDKDNPSTGILMDLARVMPQPFAYTKFYEEPPTNETLKAIAAIDPALVPHLKPPK